jgi:hypothetical protein
MEHERYRSCTERQATYQSVVLCSEAFVCLSCLVNLLEEPVQFLPAGLYVLIMNTLLEGSKRRTERESDSRRTSVVSAPSAQVCECLRGGGHPGAAPLHRAVTAARGNLHRKRTLLLMGMRGSCRLSTLSAYILFLMILIRGRRSAGSPVGGFSVEMKHTTAGKACLLRILEPEPS